MYESDIKYRKISALVDEWMEFHKGETFDLDLICRQLQLNERQHRHLVSIKLAYCVEHNKLEKINRLYRTIDNTIKYIEGWWGDRGEEGDETIDLTFPKGHDETGFSFQGEIMVYPSDILVVAGVSNKGKSCFVLNTLVENMDKYQCRLMGNEYDARKFRDRMKYFNWVEFVNDGKPKFELIERYENHKDIIAPDAINIIDWLNLGDNFWQISKILEGIKSKLHKGIAIVVIQKSEGKTLGRGGDFSRDLASVYFTIDHQRLTVEKVKSYKRIDPNGKMYSFTIEDHGSKFMGIHEVKRCAPCRGTGKFGVKDCANCIGTGYISVGD